MCCYESFVRGHLVALAFFKQRSESSAAREASAQSPRSNGGQCVHLHKEGERFGAAGGACASTVKSDVSRTRLGVDGARHSKDVQGRAHHRYKVVVWSAVRMLTCIHLDLSNLTPGMPLPRLPQARLCVSTRIRLGI